MSKSLAIRLVVCVSIGLGLAACQTSADGETARSLEDVYVFSNEPDRLGDAHFARGNYALAERYYRDAVERKPGDVASWLGLASSYDNLKRFDLADRAYLKAREVGGESTQYLNNLGYSYMLRGRFREAETLLRRAAAREPDNVVVMNNLGLLAEVRTKYAR